MNQWNEKTGVWFIYDGDCPICTQAAQAVRIKQQFGQLSTLDARQAQDDPLLQEINRRGIDLDEGMIIYANKTFYHGKDALKFMARYGEATNSFMGFCKSLFWSDALAWLTYPWMRGVRNWLLRHRKVGPIDNLNRKDEPIFKSVFGASWDNLPPVMKRHYANHPYSVDVTTVSGELNLICKPPLLWIAPVMKVMGQIPAYNAKQIPVTVHFKSDPNTRAFQFDRLFYFDKMKPYRFQSRMLPVGGNEVIELMRFGLGWKSRFRWDGEKVILDHAGYVLKLFGHFVPVPLSLLMGKGYAEEHALSDTEFRMRTHITHPLWGKIYEYEGRFEVLP